MMGFDPSPAFLTSPVMYHGSPRNCQRCRRHDPWWHHTMGEVYWLGRTWKNWWLMLDITWHNPKFAVQKPFVTLFLRIFNLHVCWWYLHVGSCFLDRSQDIWILMSSKALVPRQQEPWDTSPRPAAALEPVQAQWPPRQAKTRTCLTSFWKGLDEISKSRKSSKIIQNHLVQSHEMPRNPMFLVKVTTLY